VKTSIAVLAVLFQAVEAVQLSQHQHSGVRFASGMEDPDLWSNFAQSRGVDTGGDANPAKAVVGAKDPTKQKATKTDIKIPEKKVSDLPDCEGDEGEIPGKNCAQEVTRQQNDNADSLIQKLPPCNGTNGPVGTGCHDEKAGLAQHKPWCNGVNGPEGENCLPKELVQALPLCNGFNGPEGEYCVTKLLAQTLPDCDGDNGPEGSACRVRPTSQIGLPICDGKNGLDGHDCRHEVPLPICTTTEGNGVTCRTAGTLAQKNPECDPDTHTQQDYIDGKCVVRDSSLV
jgi:hypothetical protein